MTITLRYVVVTNWKPYGFRVNYTKYLSLTDNSSVMVKWCVPIVQVNLFNAIPGITLKWITPTTLSKHLLNCSGSTKATRSSSVSWLIVAGALTSSIEFVWIGCSKATSVFVMCLIVCYGISSSAVGARSSI